MPKKTPRELDRISLVSQGSRRQFDTALAIITIIPLLVFVTLLRMDKLREAMGTISYIMLIAGLALLMVMGYIMLSRYPATIIKLRRHLENIAHGELPDAIALFQDENDIRAIEQGMNLILEQLKEKVRDAEHENIELQKQLFQTRKLEAVGSLATGIAHEVSTPLQYISDNVTFLSRCVEDCFQCLEEHSIKSSANHTEEDIAYLREELPKSIDQTREGITRIAAIIKALKEFSRRGSDDTKSPTDLNRTVQNVAAVCRNEWRHIADMNLDLSADLTPFLCYPGDLKQTIMSLVRNAIQAIEKRQAEEHDLRGELGISTELKEGRAIIRISDNGCGIPEDHPHRIFDPFFTTRDVG
jgi:signal transduction histidine kinase